MDHLSTAPHLSALFDALAIKTARVFKQQLQSGVVAVQGGKLRRTWRSGSPTAVMGTSPRSPAKLEKLGLYSSPTPSDHDTPQ
jgi:hypothetical protein